MAQQKPQADVIRLTLPNQTEYLGVARLTVSGIANRMGFSYEEIEDIKLAVGEACTNAVKHAYKQKEELGFIHIECQVCRDRLCIEVSDQGVGFASELMPEQLTPIFAGRDLEDLDEGGLGLYLIHTLMDEVVIRSESGVAVSMTKYVRRDGVAGDDWTSSETEV
ncbi:serine-protein kinase RsbW [Brevibacillus agri]|uniref:Serine-protein kinase RsbW n=1 Tax=Brevibacillus agri TaxID=51101 RepID=A0A3M8APA5_9BACL|nr:MULTISPECIES: anti-sigma B factor RsbW [Brevibacillus]ELK42199.1 serine-protein kinase RsbW [Brevibacillus agri BAB-2500]EJL47567.1 serine-protein kinase RsbW [Brevibacillus sp. CF112]MBG9566375.1 serine/threonine protein kinase [Brevibacillus agri]MBY0054414.1 anti-sigma B factor RsbW [Brevibacillus agri]MCG5251948.1 anti-sigma B factor RsbW [Brevibacillus agri]